MVILVITFFLLMSLDVFVEEYRWYEMIVGFVMHNIPTLLMAGVLWIAWSQPRLGGYIFLLLFVTSVFFFRNIDDPIAFLIASGPLFIIAMLFILNPVSNSDKLKPVKK